jgi:acyl dehydratase
VSALAWDAVSVGDVLPEQDFGVQRVDLVRYAGASGDFNVIHWNERVATAVGLPNVIAHGMLTMALAGRVVTDWLGDPAAMIEYTVRFTRPVVVPDDDVGATVRVSAAITEKLDDRRVRIDLVATSSDLKVLGQARAVAQLT